MNNSEDKKPGTVDYPPLDFVPEVGMRIYRDDMHTPINMMLQPNHGEQIKIGIPSEYKKFVTQPDIITTETFKTFGQKFRPTLPAGREMEILEVGKGDKDGLILIGLSNNEKPGDYKVLLYNEESGDYRTAWVSLDDLAYNESESFGGQKWNVTRRNGNPLAGDRLDEILNPDSDLKIRGQDYRVKHYQEEMRRFVLEAVKAKYGEA